MEIPDQSFVLLIFIFLSAFFSGVETAFISLSDIRIQHLLEENRPGIELVRHLKTNHQRLIITILIGNNLVNIAASAIATSIAADIFASNAISITVGIMTLVILIFGEIVPKTVAMAKNEWIAVHAAPVIRTLQYVLFPVIKMLEWLTVLIAKPIGMDNNDPIITEAEIKTVVSLGEEIGEVEEDERIMIHNIFRFSDLEACEIMVDRTRVFSVEGLKSVKEVARAVVDQGYSRVPVYEDDLDNLKGVLYTKDLLQALLDGRGDMIVRDLVRPAMFIPETMLIDDLLRAFQREKVHLAMVVNEHGGVSGLITIEDLLEEIVGDIYDETDEEEIMIRKLDETKSIVRGETEVEEVNQALRLGLNEKEDYETISGFILSQLRRIPEVGEQLEINGNVIRVTKADKQRIIEVQIEKKDAFESEASQKPPDTDLPLAME